MFYMLNKCVISFVTLYCMLFKVLKFLLWTHKNMESFRVTDLFDRMATFLFLYLKNFAVNMILLSYLSKYFNLPNDKFTCTSFSLPLSQNKCTFSYRYFTTVRWNYNQIKEDKYICYRKILKEVALIHVIRAFLIYIISIIKACDEEEFGIQTRTENYLHNQCKCHTIKNAVHD